MGTATSAGSPARARRSSPPGWRRQDQQSASPPRHLGVARCPRHLAWTSGRPLSAWFWGLAGVVSGDFGENRSAGRPAQRHLLQPCCGCTRLHGTLLTPQIEAAPRVPVCTGAGQRDTKPSAAYVSVLGTPTSQPCVSASAVRCRLNRPVTGLCRGLSAHNLAVVCDIYTQETRVPGATGPRPQAVIWRETTGDCLTAIRDASIGLGGGPGSTG